MGKEKNKKGPFTARVLENKTISNSIYKMICECEQVAKTAIPGQFVSILCEDLTLRRPFSIANAYNNSFEVIYKVKGAGTAFLANLSNGDEIDLIGSLGNGFSSEKNKKHLLIGCGVGIAPVYFLANTFKQKNIDYTLLACSASKIDFEEKNSLNTIYITEDGSKGAKASLKDALNRIIESEKPDKISICGPNKAMEFAVKLAKANNIEIETALEREFACGTGVCMGCTIKICQNGLLLNKRICKDGPVFNGHEVIWDE